MTIVTCQNYSFISTVILKKFRTLILGEPVLISDERIFQRREMGNPHTYFFRYFFRVFFAAGRCRKALSNFRKVRLNGGPLCPRPAFPPGGVELEIVKETDGPVELTQKVHVVQRPCLIVYRGSEKGQAPDTHPAQFIAMGVKYIFYLLFIHKVSRTESNQPKSRRFSWLSLAF